MKRGTRLGWQTVKACGVIGAAQLLPLGIAAQIGPLGSEFQVNTYTTNAQKEPAVAMGANWAFVVVWESGGQDLPASPGVFGQRYDSAGQATGSEFRVNGYTTGIQNSAAVAATPDGGFVVVWFSTQEGNSGGVFAQRYDSTGQAIGNEFQVNSYTTGNQSRPSVAAGASGAFVVAWASDWQDGHTMGVFGQRYDSAGVPAGSEFRINSQTGGSQTDPSVAAAADGNFVVVWEGRDQDGSGDGVFGQRYGSGGQPLGTEFQVNSYTTGSQMYPAVAARADGAFSVVWTSPQFGWGIFGQCYNSEGQRVGTEFRVSDFPMVQSPAAVAVGVNGDMVVVWESPHGDGWTEGVFGQRYDSIGQPVGTEFQVNTYTVGPQPRGSVAVGDNGSFVVAWESDNQDGSRRGIFGQRFGANSCAEPLVFHPGDYRVDGVDGVDGLGNAQALTASADGRCVYVSSSGDDAIVAFSRDLATGDLAWVQKTTSANLVDPAGMAASPDGAHLYVAAESASPGRIVVFSRDSDTCQLTELGGLSDGALDEARGLAISPDGLCLYSAASGADALVVLARDSASGSLTLVEAEHDGSAGVDGLSGASSVVVTADGLNVYVASQHDDAVAAFSRNPTTCGVVFREHEQDGVAGVDGMRGARSVDASRDGSNVYVAAEVDAVAVFSRDPATGNLTFLEAEKNGINGVEGLNGAIALSVTPNGSQVYVAARVDDCVTAFQREEGGGTLSFADLACDGDVGGVDGLNGVRGVAVSPNGSHVYVAGSLDNAVAWFAGCCGNGIAEFGEDCDDGGLASGDCCSSACRFESQNYCCSGTICMVGLPCSLCGTLCGLSASSCVCQ